MVKFPTVLRNSLAYIKDVKLKRDTCITVSTFALCKYSVNYRDSLNPIKTSRNSVDILSWLSITKACLVHLLKSN